MQPYPLRFRPLLKERVWGGNALARYGHAVDPAQTIGESWEIADLPDDVEGGQSIICNGALSGHRLHDVLRNHPQMLMGSARPWKDGHFPLLFKLLDAKENLSVQVHPDEAWASTHPGAHLKSEAWYVLDAEPGARIYVGLLPGVHRADLEAAIRDNRVEQCLATREAIPGSCHYLPGGTCHALGAGITVAEIQTPSDTTFRLYDWGRTGRTMHHESALACIRYDRSPPEPDPVCRPVVAGALVSTLLTETRYFTVTHLETTKNMSLPIVTDDAPVVWLCVRGAGTVGDGEEQAALRPGTTILLPAAMRGTSASLDASTRILEIRLPHPAYGALA